MRRGSRFAGGKLLCGAVIALVAGGFSGLVYPDERPVYADHDTQMKGSDSVGPLGPAWFGDQTDFYSGATSFLVTDVSLPGNSDLPVGHQRSLQMYDDGVHDRYSGLPMFAWSNYEVPYLTGVYASDSGWKVGWYLDEAVDERCSWGARPPEIPGHDDIWESSEYFHGNHLYVPGQGMQLMSFISSTEPSNPTTGDEYHWTTKNHWRFSCLPTTKNGAAGEGFLARAPDGKKYYFDWLVSWRTAQTLQKFAVFTGVKEVLQREEFRLLLTRVEDRFGNWVNYTYSGKNLTSISANDGRQLTLTYQNGKVSSVSDGVRTWTYSHAAGVEEVTYPDSTKWRSSISGPGLTRWDPSSCSIEPMRFTGEVTVAIEQRTGAVGTFTFQPMRRGLSHVYYNPNGTCPDHPRYIDNIGLHTKTVTGPGLTAHAWSVSYGPPNGCYTSGPDACTSSSPVTRYVDVFGPGTFSRYTFGNKHRDTDGALLRVQSGTSTANVLRDTSFTYETLSALGVQAGGSYLDTIIRLEKTKTITQDGVAYTTARSNWDEYQNPQTVTDSGPNGGVRTTQYAYYNNKSKWVIGEIASSSSPGKTISRSFNVNGSVSSLTEDGVTTEFTYHSDGNVATITYPRSLVHTFSSYKLGIARSESQPEGINLSRVVNNLGLVTSATDGEGRTRSYTYDVMGRVTSIDYPRGNDATIVHAPLSETVTRGSLVEATTYDALRRPTRVVLGGIATTYTYDAYGRKTFESNPGDSIGTHHEYDALGRVKSITNADLTFKTVLYSGSSVVERDERDNYTTFQYRGYGDPETRVLIGITAADPAANVTIVRAPNDQVSSVTQGGRTRTFGYDSRNYLISETHPETGTTTYGRDAAGNMTSRTISGMQTVFTYDGQNRLTGVTYSDGTPAVTQSYSKTGKLKTVTSSMASRVLAYDTNDNLTSESVTVDGALLAAVYAYTTNDQLSTITYPVSGRVVSYAPDVLGRPTQVSGYVDAVTYWPSGLPRQINYANGIVTNYDQNSRLWPSGLHTRRAGTYYVSSSYAYDGAGNLTSISDAADATLSRTFGYDALNRLTSASGPWGSGTLAYDGGGNITSQNLGAFSLSYAYNSQNRLSSVSGSRSTTYSYDLYGNISAGGGATYTYDGVPNLRCVNCPGADKTEYEYDGSGKRVSVAKAGMVTYEFHASNGDLLVEYTPSQENRLTEYIYLGGKRVAQRVSDQAPPTSITPARSTVVESSTGSATLTVSIGGSAPTGSVTFSEGSNVLGTVFVINGQASIDVMGLGLGSHTITATYSGDRSNWGNTMVFEIKIVNLDWLPAVLDLVLSD